MNQETLKQLFVYEPETGKFVRRTNAGVKKVGDVAEARHPKGYIRIIHKGRFYLAHRLAFLYMNGYMPEQVDHINGIRDDNRWENLRGVSPSQNSYNSKKPSDNTSGVKGVYWNKRDKAWVCRINVKGKLAWSFFTKDKEEAERVTRAAREKLHAEYHRHQ